MDNKFYIQLNSRQGITKAPSNREGFTLIEILVVIAMIAILATIVIIAINPARQFAQGRNTQRTANANAILNAIGQNIADNKGVFSCNGVTYALATAVAGTDIKKGAGGADIRPCIVPTYISEIPMDPNGGTNTCTDTIPGDCATNSYDTNYTVYQNPEGRIQICAPNSITEHQISNPGPTICVTR